MALRRTRKNNSYNKDKLANKLDTLASNVAKKGVFVVTKSDPGYKVFNIIKSFFHPILGICIKNFGYLGHIFRQKGHIVW